MDRPRLTKEDLARLLTGNAQPAAQGYPHAVKSGRIHLLRSTYGGLMETPSLSALHPHLNVIETLGIAAASYRARLENTTVAADALREGARGMERFARQGVDWIRLFSEAGYESEARYQLLNPFESLTLRSRLSQDPRAVEDMLGQLSVPAKEYVSVGTIDRLQRQHQKVAHLGRLPKGFPMFTSHSDKTPELYVQAIARIVRSYPRQISEPVQVEERSLSEILDSYDCQKKLF